MDAKKCDICGKFYEEYATFEDVINQILPFVTSKDILNDFKRIIDVCPKCSDALIKTIDNLRGKR